MMTADQAATYVLKCLRTKPIQLSVPKIAGAAIHAISLGAVGASLDGLNSPSYSTKSYSLFA